jgi:hypothetical protein
LESKSGVWTSAVISAGLGRAGDAAAVDAARSAIYTVHESADETVQRSEGLPLLPPADDKGILKPWPMVETKWDGAQWRSRVICDTECHSSLLWRTPMAASSSPVVVIQKCASV